MSFLTQIHHSECNELFSFHPFLLQMLFFINIDVAEYLQFSLLHVLFYMKPTYSLHARCACVLFSRAYCAGRGRAIVWRLFPGPELELKRKMACLDSDDSRRDSRSESDEYDDVDDGKRSPSPEIPLADRDKRLSVKSFYHSPKTSPKETSLKRLDEGEARRRGLKETYDVLTTFSGTGRRHTAEVVRAGGRSRSKTKSTSHTPSRKHGVHTNDPVSHLSDKYVLAIALNDIM